MISKYKNKYVAKLKKHQKDVGRVRDSIRNDISAFNELEESCDRAFQLLQDAIDALSELA